MSEEQFVSQPQQAEENMTMDDWMQQEDAAPSSVRKGQTVRGVISTIGDQGIWVNLGSKVDGWIPPDDYADLSEEDKAALQEGAEIPVYVVNFDKNGTPILSYRQALEWEDWERARQAMESEEIIFLPIESVNRGGVVVRFGRLRGFVPASQILRVHKEAWGGRNPQEWTAAIGETLPLRIIEVNPERRRLILSERAAGREAREELKRQLIEKLQVGDVLTGRVTKLTNFGAFVNLGAADGLVPIAEISWDHIGHPSEVLEEGQEVEVKVIGLDPERRRISLSIRQLQEDPWQEKASQLRVGQLVRGTITRLERYGAFARLENGLEGLIHISEISHQRIEHPKEVLQVGEELTLRIIRIEPERRRIGLSIKKVDSLAYADLDLQLALQEAQAELEAAAAEAAETPAAEEGTPAEAETQTASEAMSDEGAPAAQVSITEAAEEPRETPSEGA